MSKIQDSGLLQLTSNDAGLDTNTVLISEYSIKTVCDQTKSGFNLSLGHLGEEVRCQWWRSKDVGAVVEGGGPEPAGHVAATDTASRGAIKFLALIFAYFTASSRQD